MWRRSTVPPCAPVQQKLPTSIADTHFVATLISFKHH